MYIIGLKCKLCEATKLSSYTQLEAKNSAYNTNMY